MEAGTVLFERFRVERLLGRGGFGTTVAVTPTDGGDTVALKVISLRGLDDWKQFDLFEREAAVLRRLDHPNIPRYLESFTHEGEDGPTFAIVQQLSPGSDLARRVADGWRCDGDAARSIARRLLDVLEYLHNQLPPVIHRDLKPHNVLLSDDGEVHLVDFGAVRAVYDKTVGGGSTIVGTYGYMAPEQMRGQATPATDLYGLAATLVFVLHGVPPIELPQHGLRFDLSALARTEPALAWWLGKLLEPDPGDRFSSVAEARAALERGPPTQLAPALPRPLQPPAAGAALQRVQPAQVARQSPNSVMFVVLGLGLVVFMMTCGFVFVAADVSEVSTAEQVVATPVVPAIPAGTPLPPPPPPPPTWPAAELTKRGDPVEFPPDAPVRKRWHAIVGNTTYRTFLDGPGSGDWRRVIVASNGQSWGSVHDPEDGIYAVDQATGEITAHVVPPGDGEKDCTGVAWTFDAFAPGERNLEFVFGTDQDKVHRMKHTGELVWTRDIDGDAEAPPFMGDIDGDRNDEVVIGSEGGTLYVLDAATGEVEWTHKAGEGPYGATGFQSQPLVRPDYLGDDTFRMFAAARDGTFRAFKGEDRALAWKFTGGSGMHSRPVVDRSFQPKNIAFSEAYGKVYLADLDTGALRWTWGEEFDTWIFGPLGIYEDARCVTVPNRAGGMHCVELETGAERWAYRTSASVTSGAVAVDVDGKRGLELVFGTEGGQLIALDKDGKELWVLEMGGPIETTPGIIGYDNKLGLVVNVNSGYLYALEFATPTHHQ